MVFGWCQWCLDGVFVGCFQIGIVLHMGELTGHVSHTSFLFVDELLLPLNVGDFYSSQMFDIEIARFEKKIQH